MSRAEGPALLWRGTIATHAEIEARVARAAAQLGAIGVREGERVAVWGAASPAWVVLSHAIGRAGGVLVPLHTRLADPEVRWQLERAGARRVLADAALAPRAPGEVMTFDELDRVTPTAEPPPDAPDPDRPHAVLFTSGTSGRPKGAVLTWANHLASARACAAVLPLTPADRWLACLPLFHIGGLNILYRCLLAGACVVLHESFSAAEANRAIDHDGVTIVSVVEVMLRRMIEERSGRPFPPSLRAVVVGGGPVAADLIEACPQALASYGLTETCSMATLVRPGAPREERRSAGRPLPGIEVRIDAGDGRIRVRGPVVMQGYADDAEATRAALAGGWLATEDLGRLDDAGCLHVLARREDLIVSGGENVYPAEIEAALCLHPAVSGTVVIGVPDATWGQAPLALVTARGAGADPAALRAFLEQRLARHKLPRIRLIAEIPLLPNGKPDRAALRALYGEAGPAA